MPGRQKPEEAGRTRSIVASLSDRALPVAAAALVVGLSLFGVFSIFYRPDPGANTKSTGEAVIPFFEAGDEESLMKPSEDDAPTPPPTPTLARSSSSEVAEATPPTGPWAYERIEAATKLQQPPPPGSAVDKETPTGSLADQPIDTEAPPRPPPGLPTDSGTSAQPPMNLPPHAQTPSQSPASSGTTTSSPPAVETAPRAEDMADPE